MPEWYRPTVSLLGLSASDHAGSKVERDHERERVGCSVGEDTGLAGDEDETNVARQAQRDEGENVACRRRKSTTARGLMGTPMDDPRYDRAGHIPSQYFEHRQEVGRDVREGHALAQEPNGQA